MRTSAPSSHPLDALGLYLSIPFCRGKCTYCNFASGVYPASDHARYVGRLIQDMEGASAWSVAMQAALPRRVDTIYLGGGTPVLLAAELFTKMFAAIRERFDINSNAEITVECAPGQLPDLTLEAMVAAGVNRVSLGVQSFIDREASLSGRFHTRAQVLDDLGRLRRAGISNLSLDLLAGLTGQTLESWRESLSVLIDTGVPHCSVYMLEIDEESRLGRELIGGGARYGAELVPNDDTIAQMYEEAVPTLEAAGLQQYEISNFARDGQQSVHNLRYWQRRPYLGLGLDASSMLRAIDHEHGEGPAVLRTTTTDDLGKYLANGPDGPGDAEMETAWLGQTQQLEEAWFLGLRLNGGVKISSLQREFGRRPVRSSVAVAHRLAKDGLVVIEETGREETVRLTDRGRLISNDVFSEFLGLGIDAAEGPRVLSCRS